MLSVTFHSVTVRCQATCSEPRRQSQQNRTAKAAIYWVASWLAGLGKLLQSIELFTKHAFYSRRDLLESAIDESTDAVRELNAGVVGVACQLPSQASSDTGRLQRSERS